jgi:hypothetical protein
MAAYRDWIESNRAKVAGLLLSAADAVITKAYVPILALGAIGGAAIGWLVERFGR